MKGKDLVKWIQENKAEESDVIVVDRNRRYLDITFIWDGEMGSVMLDTNAPEKREADE